MRSYRAENSRKDRVLRALLSRGRPWLAAAGLAGVVGVGRLVAGPEVSPATVEVATEENGLLSSAQYIEAAVTPSDANELGVSTRWDLPNLDHPGWTTGSVDTRPIRTCGRSSRASCAGPAGTAR